MSVVCCRIYDNKIEIASDAITVRGFTQSKSKNIKHSKLMEINDMIIGGVGLSENNNLMFLFAETHKPKDASIESIIRFKFEFDKWVKEFGSENNYNAYIILYDKKAYVVHGLNVMEITKYEAIGAGEDYALAALYLDHNVVESVEVACELSIFCEKPITHFTMKR